MWHSTGLNGQGGVLYPTQPHGENLQKSSAHGPLRHGFLGECLAQLQRLQIRRRCALALLVLALPGILRAQFSYYAENGTMTITGYRGLEGQVSIPSTIDGLPVTTIGGWAFLSSDVTSITIPDSITSIESGAFADCTRLTNIAIPSSVTSIVGGVDGPFDGCASLTNITVDPLNPRYCSVDGVVFDKSITTLVQYPPGRSGAYSIPESVNTIANYAFCLAPKLTTITVPETVTSVGSHAFSSCTALTNVTLPSSVTSLGSDVFSGCARLMHFTIPDSVTNVGSGSFQSCTNLWDVVLGKGLTSIQADAFEGCSGLTNVTVPNNITSIEFGAFSLCTGLKSLTLPDNVAIIGQAAFWGCTGLQHVTLPDSVTNLGSYVFEKCTNLEHVVLGKSLTYIPSGAFIGCASLSIVTLPASVRYLAPDAFEGCTALTNLSIDPLNPNFSSVDGVLLNKAQTKLLFYPFGKLGDYAVPNTVTSIGSGAFSCCTGLNSVTIGDAVTNLESGAFASCTNLADLRLGTGLTAIDTGAFRGCTALKRLTLPNSLKSLGPYAFADCTALNSVTIGDNLINIESSAFAGCNRLADLNIGTAVSVIGNAAFSGCTGLKSIALPDGLKSIDESAFAGCSSLIDLSLPHSLTSVGGRAFAECRGLTNVFVGRSLATIGQDALLGCSSLLNITVDPLNSAYSSLEGVLFDKGQQTLLVYPLAKTGVYIVPPAVTRIGTRAFAGSDSLTGIVLSGGVTSIGYQAFLGCAKLTTVTASDGLRQIEDRAFEACASLISLSIPDSVTRTGDMFAGSYSVTQVFLGKGVTTCPAFSDCTNLQSISVSDLNPGFSSLDGVRFDKTRTSLLQYPLAKAGAYIIPDGVTNFDCVAFASCAHLTRVVIPDSVVSIERSRGWYDYVSFMIPFTGCTSLTNIAVAPLNSCFSSRDGVLFDKDQTTLLAYPPGRTGSYEIPRGVRTIPLGPFGNCPGLTSLTIPDTLCTIEGWLPYGTTFIQEVFLGCSGLTNIIVDPLNSYWSSLDGVMFNKDRTTLFAYPAARPGAAYIVPATVQSIAPYAFGARNLTSVYFLGDRPWENSDPEAINFRFADGVTVYYLPGRSGWNQPDDRWPGKRCGGRPFLPWRADVQLPNEDVFVRDSDPFGFNLVWADGQSVVVEACTDLANPVWLPLGTNLITQGSANFSDPQRTNFSNRFYRVRGL